MRRSLTLLLIILSNFMLQSNATASEFSSMQKLKVLRELPSPQGGIRYMSKASIVELNQHYKKALVEAGWKIEEEQTDDKSFGNATLTRDGEYLALVMGGNPAAKPPTIIVSLKPIGTISSKDLPHYSPVEPLYTSPQTSIYVTADPVSTVADRTHEILSNSGWSSKLRSGDEKSQYMELRKNKIALVVTVQVAPAQGNKTTIQYGVSKVR